MRYLLFGTGDYYQRYKKWFEKENIAALLDNAKSKQNKKIDGIRIVSPEEGIKLGYDAIIILSFFVTEMKAQLIELGVEADKIYHFYDCHFLFGEQHQKHEVKYYQGTKEVNLHNKGKKVLLLSQDLELTGPAIALLQVAKILEQNNYQVVFASMIDGRLKERLIDEQISVIVDENLQIQTMREAEWTTQFDLIFCNTINFHIFLSDCNTNIPIIWWLHEPLFFYGGIRRENLGKIPLENLDIYTVGNIAAKAIHSFLPDMNTGNLLYGVKDECGLGTDQKEKKDIIFTVIGYINEIKGQDILINAILKLKKNMLERCTFLLVGQNTSQMAMQISKKIVNYACIRMLGIKSREEIHAILSKTSVLICPSRLDAMPTVCAEAMMHNVPCLVSDATGTADYIKDNENGFIFQSENQDQLAQKIEYCIDNQDRLDDIGKRARAIYEEYFSDKVFQNNLLEIIKKSI